MSFFGILYRIFFPYEAAMDTDQFSDQEIIAKTIYGESRNQPYIGQTAIACVIINRANHGGWWGKTPRDVCLKPWQFSCWNANDPNRPIIMAVDASDHIYATCMEIASMALSGDLADITDGADSYCVTGLVTDWNRNLIPVAVIGAHSFYRTV
jgi:spore germination cell wall hydrolase CwlJ-like protein